MKKFLSLLNIISIIGTSIPNIIAAETYSKEEILKQIKENYKDIKLIKINNSSFVEKVKNYFENKWELSVVLSKEKILEIIKTNLFVENNKNEFEKEIKKIIIEIKKNSINLSAQYFDDNAIDAYTSTIWKNFSDLCDLYLTLGINQKIILCLNIFDNEWLFRNNKFFQIIGEKTEWEKNDYYKNEIKKFTYNNGNYKNIIEYIKEIIYNEQENIKIKYQNNKKIIFILANYYAERLFKIIDINNLEDFEKIFKEEIRDHINNSFFPNYLPSDLQLKKITNILFQNKDKNNYLSRLTDKIILEFDLENENNNNLVFKNYYDFVKNPFKNYYVEKVKNDNEKNKWELSVVLSKEKILEIINLFSQNNKDEFKKEIKKILIEIKKNSINLSAQYFDDNAIDAYTSTIWKNFSDLCDLYLTLGINQKIILCLNIFDNEWLFRNNKFFQIIGEKTEWEKQLEKKQRKNTDLIKKNKEECNKNKENKFNKYNSNIIEKWYNNKIKIKINKITLAKISILLFLIKDKNIFIENLIILFKTFKSEGTYLPNKEDIRSFAYLIWKNFGYYYNIFLKLKNNESVRITSYSNYPDGYWDLDNADDYNEIVDKNNNATNLTISNNKKIWISHDDELKRKKRPYNKEQGLLLKENETNQMQISLSSIIDINNINLYVPNSNGETIIDILKLQNPFLNKDNISININEKEKTWEIIPAPNTNYYSGSVRGTFTLIQDYMKQQDNQYDVPGDNSCLFWAIATPYLLQVRNNDSELQNRFIQLFGQNSLQYFFDIKKILQEFDLNNYFSNKQSWYTNKKVIFLITTVFRNRVVDYISEHLDTFHGENQATFRSSILSTQRSQQNLLNYTSDEQLIQSYLILMRTTNIWGGSIEIEAMTNLLNTSINVDNSSFLPYNNFQNNNIQLFYINGNHFNFGLSNQNIEQNQQKQADINTDIFNKGHNWNNLNKIILKTNLGKLPDNKPETIFKKLIELNPLLNSSEIFIDEIQNDNAGVIIKHKLNDDEVYPYFVRFTLPKNKETLISQEKNNKKELNQVISKTNLGKLPDNKPETIFKKLIELNPLLNSSEIFIDEIQKNSAVINIIPNSSCYIGGFTFIRFTLPEGINNIQTNVQYENMGINDWKTVKIDLETSTMPIPIEFQKGKYWCTLAVLQNILINNIGKNYNICLSQAELFSYFLREHKSNVNEIQGLYLYNIYKYIKSNDEIFQNLGFVYSYFNLNTPLFYEFITNKKSRMKLIQKLIWNSLYLNTPVFTNLTLSFGNHSVLIIAIEPNEDPLKTLYIFRDGDPEHRDYTKQRERYYYTGEQLYNLIFNKKFFSDLLINNKIYASLLISDFIKEIIGLYKNPNNIIENIPHWNTVIGYAPWIRAQTPLSSEDSVNTEDDIESRIEFLFNKELLIKLFYDSFL